jgi:hypothetical protein
VFFSSFISASEMQAFAQALPPEHIQPFLSNLTDMRVSVFTADAWRSFFIIAIGAVMLWLFLEKKFKAQWLVAGIIVICLVDMWGVNKRYLNDSDFIKKTDQQQMFSRTATDDYILQDTTKYYRVLNMATSTFNDGVTPYWHNTIGGYHAAKLRRYQDLIDVHISGEMMALQQDIFNTQGQLDSVDANGFKVLNMLNTKWVIMPAQDGSTLPVENPHAMGNAWFVDRISFVDNADEEIAALSNIDLNSEAIAHREFESVLEGFDLGAIPQPASVQPDSDQSNLNVELKADSGTTNSGILVQPALAESYSESTIKLVDYDSDYLIYEVDAIKDELAVFSDVYYPKGWQVSIDGAPAEMIRANYILRALAIRAGTHKVEFRFEPQSIKTTDGIAYAALLIMLLTSFYLIYRRVRTEKLEK